MTLAMSIEENSKEAFLLRIDEVLTQGIKNVFFSFPQQNLPAKLLGPPRFDIVLSGRKHMRYAGSKKMHDIYLGAGDVHYTPSFATKTPVWDELHRMISLVFVSDYIRITYIDYNEISDYFQHHGAKIYYHTFHPLSLPGYLCLQALDSSLHDESVPQFRSALVETILTLVREILSLDSEKKLSASQLTFREIMFYLHRHYPDPINRESVAANFGVSPSYISRLFNKYSSCSFSKLLQKMRLNHAATLLTNEKYTVSEISEMCGYSYPTFFNNTFKQYFGMSPQKYRLSQHSMREA